jgi:hypothetical protein
MHIVCYCTCQLLALWPLTPWHHRYYYKATHRLFLCLFACTRLPFSLRHMHDISSTSSSRFGSRQQAPCIVCMRPPWCSVQSTGHQSELACRDCRPQRDVCGLKSRIACCRMSRRSPERSYQRTRTAYQQDHRVAMTLRVVYRCPSLAVLSFL